MSAAAPYAETMGFEASRDAEGRLVLALPYSVRIYGRPGFVHGGALAGLMETVTVMTLAEGEDPPKSAKPINITATYLRGAVQKTTYARATIVRRGRRIANVDVVAWQDDPDKPVATAQINLMLG